MTRDVRLPDFGGRQGFVLPVALVALVLMALISAAGLHSARAAFRTADASRQSAVALAAADAGAAWTLLHWNALVPALPPPGDSVEVAWRTLPDGSLYRSVVVAPPAAAGATPAPLVLLRTTGRVAPPGNARRTIATWVEPGAGALALCCSSAFLVQSRLRVDGSVRNDPVPEVDGTDRPPPGWPADRCVEPTADLPGVVSSDLGSVDVRRNGDVTGAPPLQEDPSVGPGSFTDFGGTTYAQLAANANLVLAGNRRIADALGPVEVAGACDTTVDTNWGAPEDPTGVCGAWFPTIHVQGNLDLQGRGSGQGVLLVDGDLDVDGEVRFYGVVVVQGRLRLRDEARIIGAVLVRGGASGSVRSEIQGQAKLQYSSCAVRHAQRGLLGGLTTAATGRFWYEVIG